MAIIILRHWLCNLLQNKQIVWFREGKIAAFEIKDSSKVVIKSENVKKEMYVLDNVLVSPDKIESRLHIIGKSKVSLPG